VLASGAGYASESRRGSAVESRASRPALQRLATNWPPSKTKCLRLLKARMQPCSANEIKRRETMPHILVMADRPGDRRDGPVMLRERVNTADFESDHF